MILKKTVFLFGTALCLLTVGVFAQDMSGISLDEINRRATELKDEAAILVGVAEEKTKAQKTEAEVLVEAAKSNAAKADISGIEGIDKGDFEGLLKGRAAQSQEGLVVFVSLSMPKESLRKVILDTSSAGGMVLFRGFPNNSMQQFQQGLAGVLQKGDPIRNVAVDPRMFQAFNIANVPAYVAFSKPLNLCTELECESPVPEHDVMHGNVPLSYVLNEFASGGGPGAPVARTALIRMGMK
jgi:conjugal transfer pilus assembly protein TrbC